jgi:hypothetical protein
MLFKMGQFDQTIGLGITIFIVQFAVDDGQSPWERSPELQSSNIYLASDEQFLKSHQIESIWN